VTWIIFDEADHYTPAPHFCLPSNLGPQICLRDYHEDCNLVLIFTHSLDCLSCRETLQDFASRQSEYSDHEARILAVLPVEDKVLQANPDWSRLPFPLLSDPNGNTRKVYARLMEESLVSKDDSLVFVLDRYNAPYAALVDRELGSSSLHQDIQSWLAYIGVQCPE
jgi:peroxiredoxin